MKIGDNVFIEQAWEDESGQYHDEYATISRILSDGTLKFRIGHWKTRKMRDQVTQAWLNKTELFEDDVKKV